jgi:hypothetical protein
MANFEIDKTETVNDSPKLKQTRCASCGAKFQYFDESLYKPKTCANYDCMIGHLRHSQHFHVPYSN